MIVHPMQTEVLLTLRAVRATSCARISFYSDIA